jgi:CDP-glucose 4,6-dehydratase
MRALNLDPSLWSGRSVLVTGHSGFKGAWLSLWLQALGARVSGLAPGTPTSPSLYEAARVAEGVSAHDGDVRDYEAVRAAVGRERPDTVFHLAAQPMVRRSLREPRATYEINVMGTVNVLDAVREVGDVRSVVVVTSDKCYANPGHGAGRRAFVEDDPMGGSDPYSSSKGCAELVSAAFRESFFSGAAAPRLATARAGNVIGGGDWGEDRLIPDVIRAAEAGSTVRVRNPDAVRPWQHVLNPLSGYLLLAQELDRGDRIDEGWNFGPDPGDARPVRWIADRLTQLWPGELRWELDQSDNPPEAGFLSLDSSKARARLGWSPAWDLDDALTRVVEWHEAYRRGEDMRQVSLAQIEQFAQVERDGP